jgi:hypothetical protein
VNDFLKLRAQCHGGIKAFQNVNASSGSFERLAALSDSQDVLVLSALLHAAVIRYGKPFVQAESNSGKVVYPTKHLKSVQGFSMDVHEHLLKVRNTLIAHDDFTQIEPRILFFSINPQNTDVQIPTAIVVANKCISHPADVAAAQTLLAHTQACRQGILNKLHADITQLRAIALKHPDQLKNGEKYSKHCGTYEIAAGGSPLSPPDFSDDKWLDNEEPDYSSVHNGFRYEGLRIKVDFHGPERIFLPDGSSIELTPT